MYDERPRPGSLDGGGTAPPPTGPSPRGESGTPAPRGGLVASEGAGAAHAYVGPTPIPAATQQPGVTPAPRVQVTGPLIPSEGRAKAPAQAAAPAPSPWAVSQPIDRDALPSSHRPASHAAATPAAPPYGAAPRASVPYGPAQGPVSTRPRPPHARAPSRRPDALPAARPAKRVFSRQVSMMAVTALIVGAFSGLTVLVLGGWFPSRQASPTPTMPPLLPPLPSIAAPAAPAVPAPTYAAPAEPVAPAPPAGEPALPLDDDPEPVQARSRPARPSKGTDKVPAAPAQPVVAAPAPGPSPPATAAAPPPAPAEPPVTAAPAPPPPTTATPAPPSTTKKPAIVKDIF